MTPSLRLHHIGVLVADIPAASPAYARLGYVPRSGIIHDPCQTAHVQFFSLGTEPVLLELITPDRPDSKLSAALERGGGFHHLCYATADLDEACRDLNADGMTLIRRPEPAVAFGGRRIAWLVGRDRMLTELVERGSCDEL